MQRPSILQHLKRAAQNVRGHNDRRTSRLGCTQLDFVVGDAPHEDWEQTKRGARLSFVPLPVIRKTDKVFTMGSCFAREVRHALHDREFELFPRYDQIEFDPVTQKFGKLSRRGHVNHYNTFTIRQEFEHAFGGVHYDLEDFTDHALLAGTAVSDGKAWQDPYRRNVYAATKEALADLSQKIDACIRDGIDRSDVYVLTLGLTEVWRNDRNGLYANQIPDNETGGGKRPGFTFERSTYEQNFDNMRTVCTFLAKNFPHKKIILTVSPVPLKRTFSGNDIIVANMESKSILRAVAGALSAQFSNVIYWPSYEIALMRDLYEEDGRHVTPEGVRAIIEQFLAVHLEGYVWPADAACRTYNDANAK
jgi:hypothetical protein